MKLIDFLFKLIMVVSPITSTDYGNLYKEANDWYNKIALDDEGTSSFLKTLKKYNELWYVQLAFAFLYPFAKREFYLYANPEMELKEQSEED